MQKILKALNPARWLTCFSRLLCTSEPAGCTGQVANGELVKGSGQEGASTKEPCGSSLIPGRCAMAAEAKIAVHASTCAGQNDSKQENSNGIQLIDETKDERRAWMASVKDQVNMSAEACEPHPARPVFSSRRARAWLCMQVFSWQFNVFDFGSQTRGHPLITMTVTLLEYFELLVRGAGRGVLGR